MFLSEFNIQSQLKEYLMGVKKDISSRTFRSAPSDLEQGDFFVPGLYDLATKDNRGVMDVAVFRLSKKDKRANDVMIHYLPDGYVRITSGPDGMASIWDYDIILMGISYLTEAMNKYRSGLGEKPGRIFSPQVSDILKFCRQSDGGRQYEAVESALRRLKQTSLEIIRGEKKTRGGRTIRETTGSGLINDYKTISYADTGRVMAVEIELPNWLYSAVVEAENPEVLTVHPDYFLLKPGLGRFLYRLARVAAGKNEAKWSFRLIYERSGSQGTFKRCSYELREFVKRNDLPEYDLYEESGRDGPLLIIRYRSEKQYAASLGS